MRSIFAPSTSIVTGSSSSSVGCSASRSDSVDDAADELGEVGRAQVRFEDAARDTVQVQQVRHDPVELARVHRDTRSEVARFVRPQVLLALEGDGEAEDRGERRPQVVRDGLQERRLELVDRAELGGLFPLSFQCAFELRRALGRLGHHALPVERRALLVTDQHGLVVDPHDASVLGEHPVVGAVGRAGRHDRLEGRPHRRHVVRVEAVHPACGIGQPLLDGVPEDPFDRRADVEERAGSVDLRIRVLHVDDPGEVPDQRPEALELVLGALVRRHGARVGASHRSRS